MVSKMLKLLLCLKWKLRNIATFDHRTSIYPLFGQTFQNTFQNTFNTGKSLSEALILASTNPQYGDRLFIELQVQYMKIPSSEHVVYTNCILFWHSEQCVHRTCTELVVFWCLIFVPIGGMFEWFCLIYGIYRISF